MSDGIYDSCFSASVTGTKVEVSAVPLDIGAYHMLNNAAAITYVQVFYKLAAAVTVGSTAADVVIPLPVSGGATINFAGKGWRTRGPVTMAATTTRTGSSTATVDVVLWKAR
jgi:hypothetical protein